MGLDLTVVAASLEGLEETIISALVERAQFRLNQRIYLVGQSGFDDIGEASLLSLRLRMQEEMDAVFGRFHVPEERPFNVGLPSPRRRVLVSPSGLALGDFNAVNITAEILDSYLKMLPSLCRDGDDQQYGSSVEHDVHALRAVSRRVHYGAMYVAECKYVAHPAEYEALVAAADREAITARLTRPEVEEAILARVRGKVESAQRQANPLVRHLVDPAALVDYYRATIIPLTKKGEVAYLFHRRSTQSR